ncbi:Putative Flp pilus-assembly TadE/G-like [Selenomonas sp. WCT3]|uniref:TadE/TadG family type IV pilus assembly protein n=1 Tax=Selenomonas sp. WCT3 TaxID=3158785 RepID=UPI00088568F3|nr:Putative Flp pilus-assembly TadE/G-like [Selenomonas ruminantium]
MIAKYRQQKGAILALTALIFPLLIAFTGIAIDFGNVYLHKSILQNSADAAALGGAKMRLNGKFDKGTADKKAKALIKDNQKYALSDDPYLAVKKSKSNPKKTQYYVVKLTEKVPMIFLRYFNFEFMEISAHANAKIYTESTSPTFPLFNNLVTFENSFYVVNSNQKEFNGNIIHTNKNASVDIKHDINSSGTDECNLQDSSGRKWNPSGDDYYNGSLAIPLDDSKNKSLKDYIESLKNSSSTKKISMQNDIHSQTLHSSDLSKSKVIFVDGSGDGDKIVSRIELDGPIDSDPNATHILIVTKGTGNLIVKKDINCKLLYINLSYDNFAIETDSNSDVTLHAAIYAPNAGELNWNPSGINFYGSLASKNVKIQSSSRTFTHESPDISGGDGGTASADVSLADDSDVDWS